MGLDAVMEFAPRRELTAFVLMGGRMASTLKTFRRVGNLR